MNIEDYQDSTSHMIKQLREENSRLKNRVKTLEDEISGLKGENFELRRNNHV